MRHIRTEAVPGVKSSDPYPAKELTKPQDNNIARKNRLGRMRDDGNRCKQDNDEKAILKIRLEMAKLVLGLRNAEAVGGPSAC
eukprot:6198629-Pleurochrysis_carterae.AAC.3